MGWASDRERQRRREVEHIRKAEEEKRRLQVREGGREDEEGRRRRRWKSFERGKAARDERRCLIQAESLKDWCRLPGCVPFTGKGRESSGVGRMTDFSRPHTLPLPLTSARITTDGGGEEKARGGEEEAGRGGSSARIGPQQTQGRKEGGREGEREGGWEGGRDGKRGGERKGGRGELSLSRVFSFSLIQPPLRTDWPGGFSLLPFLSVPVSPFAPFPPFFSPPLTTLPTPSTPRSRHFLSNYPSSLDGIGLQGGGYEGFGRGGAKTRARRACAPAAERQEGGGQKAGRTGQAVRPPSRPPSLSSSLSRIQPWRP